MLLLSLLMTLNGLGSALATTAAHDTSYYTSYCCDGVCTTGGCTVPSDKFGIENFYPVDDCASCAPTFDNQTSALTTTCRFCDDNGTCRDSVTNTGCVVPDATHKLFAFKSQLRAVNATGRFAALPSTEFCCYWLSDQPGVYSVTLSTSNGCPIDAGGQLHLSHPLVAFVEHRFDYACPATPPCAGGCSGHGLCAVTQCVCDAGYVGELCAERCDATLCIHGHCRANAQQWPPLPSPTTTTTTTMTTTYDTATGSGANSSTTTSSSPAPTPMSTSTNSTLSPGVCHCFDNFLGEDCSSCPPQYVGARCDVFCLAAPCNLPHMTGNCTIGVCDCAPGWAGEKCDQCDSGYFGPACNCTQAVCGENGVCNDDGKCDCINGREGPGCVACTCSHRGKCQKDAPCLCNDPIHFGGERCERCEPPYFDLSKNCTTMCVDSQCGHGASCNSTTGLCDCPNFTSGQNCTGCVGKNLFGLKCDVYCDAATNCSSAGTCNVNTGACDCPAGFGGDCSSCLSNYYPAKVCSKRCDADIDCNGHGHCDANGNCVCSSNIIYTSDNCDVRVYVYVVPCVIVVLAFSAFFFRVWWKKRKEYDEWNEPLLY